MFGIPRRRSRYASRVALIVAAPLWAGLVAASFGQAGPPAQLDDAVQDEPLPGETSPADALAGSFTPGALELRTSSDAANYGKPVIRKPGQKRPRKLPTPALPSLVPYPTSAEARRAAKRNAAPLPDDPNSVAPSPGAAALPPLPTKTRPKVEDEPYAPVGVDFGLLRVKPYIESDIGFNDNPNQATHASPELRGSAFAREELGLSAASDWSNHAFNGDLRLGYTDYFRSHEADAPDGQGKFLTRIDVARDLKINIDGKFSLTTESASSPNINNGGLPVTLASRPIVAVFGGGLGVTRTFNRLELTLRGSVERDYWQDADFADGSVQRLSLDSFNDYGLTARAAYEVTPGVKPFVEATADRRDHDSDIDSSGYDRNSTGLSARGGTTFELSRLLTGDIAVGYADRTYADVRLADLRGATFDSSLVWTATALTKVTLRGATTLDETTIAGSPGGVTRVTSLELAHALMRNLTLTAIGSVQTSRYANVGIGQTTYQAGLAAEYNLTRSILLRGSFTRQRMDSSQPGTDYTADVFLVGLRFQR